MPEPGSRKPASDLSEADNLLRIAKEGVRISPRQAVRSAMLRDELASKGLKGFKKGGKVKKTGVYKLHKGEKVVTASAAKRQAKPKPVVRRKAARR